MFPYYIDIRTYVESRFNFPNPPVTFLGCHPSLVLRLSYFLEAPSEQTWGSIRTTLASSLAYSLAPTPKFQKLID
jgi:hypothetical protein